MDEPLHGEHLKQIVAGLGRELGLRARTEVRVGRRIWGAQRRIDVVLTETNARRSLGIECKYQRVGGTAEEKIPATIQDIAAWPIDGVVCFAGVGFTDHMRSFMYASGKGVDLADLRDWLRLYFQLD